MVKILSALLLCSGGGWADVISVYPSSPAVGLGSSALTVAVNVSGIVDLYAFEFDIQYDPSVLSAVSVTEGSLFNAVGVFFSPGVIDNTGGAITFIGDSLSGPGPGVTTDGTLALLLFDAIGAGSTNLTLANVILLDSTLNDIDTTEINNGVAVTPEPGILQLLGATGGILWLALFAFRRLGIDNLFRRDQGQ